MKTMKLGDTIIRVDDKVSESYKKRGYVYCPKSEWKTKIRDAEKARRAEQAAKKAEEKAKEVETNTNKKGKKEKRF